MKWIGRIIVALVVIVVLALVGLYVMLDTIATNAVAKAGTHATGGPAGRAAACAVLIKYVCHRLGRQLPLSVKVSMALALSETGPAGESDIYPDLYLQHSIDELQRLCDARPGDILLSTELAQEPEIAQRVNVLEEEEHHILRGVHPDYRALLRRQAGQILADADAA